MLLYVLCVYLDGVLKVDSSYMCDEHGKWRKK